MYLIGVFDNNFSDNTSADQFILYFLLFIHHIERIGFLLPML